MRVANITAAAREALAAERASEPARGRRIPNDKYRTVTGTITNPYSIKRPTRLFAMSTTGAREARGSKLTSAA
jgi:hypothetical protein